MNVTAIGCGCCLMRLICPDDGTTACSDWEGDGVLVVMDEVQYENGWVFFDSGGDVIHVAGQVEL